MDSCETVFGIRTLRLDPLHGLRINGKSIKLYGGCIHHDNGIAGSAAYDAAESRKIHKLKQAGFNAVRFSHNPMSEKLLAACDRYGMPVMDELTDVWCKEKTEDDFSRFFAGEYEDVVRAMVSRVIIPGDQPMR